MKDTEGLEVAMVRSGRQILPLALQLPLPTWEVAGWEGGGGRWHDSLLGAIEGRGCLWSRWWHFRAQACKLCSVVSTLPDFYQCLE